MDPAHIYVDHISGAKSSRPQFEVLCKALRDVDVLVATRLDRVGRSTTHLVSLLDELALCADAVLRRGDRMRAMLGLLDVEGSNGRQNNRTPMQWDGGPNAGFSDAFGCSMTDIR